MTDEEPYPNWYEPSRPLLTFIDGPRAGSWAYVDWWAQSERSGEASYEPVPDGEPVPHRLDARITAAPWRQLPSSTAV